MDPVPVSGRPAIAPVMDNVAVDGPVRVLPARAAAAAAGESVVVSN
jgi:hypothetical protein